MAQALSSCPDGWVRLEKLVFYALLLASVLPVLSSEHFPSEDLPLHAANASVYLNSGNALVGQYYVLDAPLQSNFLGDAIMSLLLLALPGQAVTTVMVLALAFGVPLAVRLGIWALNPNRLWLALLALPIGLGRHLYLGYVNFLTGVAVSILAFTLWHRKLRTPHAPIGWWALMVSLLILTFLGHPIPFLAVFLMVGAAALNDSIDAAAAGEGSVVSLFLRRLWPILAAGSVPLVMVLVGTGGDSPIYPTDFLGKLIQLPVSLVFALSTLELPFGVLWALVVSGIGVTALVITPAGQRLRHPGFLLAATLLAVIYVAGPEGLGVGFDIGSRVALYLFICVLLWMTTPTLPAWAPTTALVSSLVIVLGLVVVRVPNHRALSAEIDEYLSGHEVVAPGSTILPLWMTSLESPGGIGYTRRLVRPLIERVGDLTTSGETVDLHHLSGAIDIFPFRFSPGHDIRETVEGEDWIFPFIFGETMVDIEVFERGDARVDYLWIWGRPVATPEVIASPDSARMLQHIEDHYELVFVSEPRAMLEVFARADD